jgi:hypothetical protein
MAEVQRWNANTTLVNVQFDWEHDPTQRPVRLTSPSPAEGDPVRISMGGAEVEGVIAGFKAGVLHVRLEKPKMQKAGARTTNRRNNAAG